MKPSNQDIHILIVEDSPTQAEMLRLLLAEHGYSARVAQNGEEALVLIHSSAPSLVISDIVMPGIDGYELCKALHNNPLTSDIPVLLLTQLDRPGDILRALECGAASFITKGSSEEYLVDKINELLEGSKVDNHQLLCHNDLVDYCGERFEITASREKILSLLIATYEAAVGKNKELMSAQFELKELNFRLEEALEEVRELSLHDPLTGLPNRRMLDINAAYSLARAQRLDSEFGVMMMDIDHFKKYNDTFGHDAGDMILASFAGILSEATRKTDLVVRYGGEEFLILLNDFDLEGAKIFAERLRVDISTSTEITASIGIAWYQNDSDFDSVVKRADEAMYRAKHNGRNRVEVS